MKTKSIFICTIVICSVATCASAHAQTAQQAPKAPLPSSPGAMIGPTPPSPEAVRLAALISTTATAKCGGKDADAAPDCRIKALWELTQCPPVETGAAVPVCDPPPSGQGFAYDVSSIKPHKDDGTNGGMAGPTPDGYRAVNMTMQTAVQNAYARGTQIQITGGPGWITELHYDIEAKFTPEVADALKKLSPDERLFVRGYMTQQLLKERAHLVAHVETKEVPSFDLVVGKNGPKFTVSDPNSKANGAMSMRMDQGKMVLTGKGMPMAVLARSLQAMAGRPTFDKTGLTGIYDVTLEFVREQGPPATGPDGGASSAGLVPAPDPAGPSIMDALEQQLGLKLVPSHGPQMLVVVDHIDKPDAN